MKPLPTRTMLEAFADLAYRKHDGPDVCELELPATVVKGGESQSFSVFFPRPCSPRELVIRETVAAYFLILSVQTGHCDELEFYTPPVRADSASGRFRGLPLVGHPCPLGTSVRMSFSNVRSTPQRLEGRITYALWEASSHV